MKPSSTHSVGIVLMDADHPWLTVQDQVHRYSIIGREGSMGPHTLLLRDYWLWALEKETAVSFSRFLMVQQTISQPHSCKPPYYLSSMVSPNTQK